MTIKNVQVTFIILLTLLLSCRSSPQFNNQDEIFHASGASGGIGGIYFALYKNHTYQICESGGLGQTCYDGTYMIAGDTIILKDLNKDSYLKNNRLLVCRYNEQDSTYWQWKYPTHANQWADMKQRDLAMDNSGDVHQIDNDNRLILDPTYYFVIMLDSLNNYR